jgi:hypothetical protein
MRRFGVRTQGGFGGRRGGGGGQSAALQRGNILAATSCLLYAGGDLGSNPQRKLELFFLRL